MSDFLRPGEKAWSPPGCKDEGQDKQHDGESVIRGKRKGSPVVLLERPFIRCSSCRVIYFSITSAMLWNYGLADLGQRRRTVRLVFFCLGFFGNPNLKPEPK